ncbi:MAG: hypothetical protein AAGG56_12685 [Pseudomonadota bacterium]
MSAPSDLSQDQRECLAMLGPNQVDCAIAVMLKILDGKCKMPPQEARIMTAVYDAVKRLPAQHLGRAEHKMIAKARAEADPRFRAEIYEARVLAETRISRPVMKAFKAGLRRDGVLPLKGPTRQERSGNA